MITDGGGRQPSSHRDGNAPVLKTSTLVGKFAGYTKPVDDWTFEPDPSSGTFDVTEAFANVTGFTSDLRPWLKDAGPKQPGLLTLARRGKLTGVETMFKGAWDISGGALLFRHELLQTRFTGRAFLQRLRHTRRRVEYAVRRTLRTGGDHPRRSLRLVDACRRALKVLGLYPAPKGTPTTYAAWIGNVYDPFGILLPDENLVKRTTGGARHEELNKKADAEIEKRNAAVEAQVAADIAATRRLEYAWFVFATLRDVLTRSATLLLPATSEDITQVAPLAYLHECIQRELRAAGRRRPGVVDPSKYRLPDMSENMTNFFEQSGEARFSDYKDLFANYQSKAVDAFDPFVDRSFYDVTQRLRGINVKDGIRKPSTGATTPWRAAMDSLAYALFTRIWNDLDVTAEVAADELIQRTNDKFAYHGVYLQNQSLLSFKHAITEDNKVFSRVLDTYAAILKKLTAPTIEEKDTRPAVNPPSEAEEKDIQSAVNPPSENDAQSVANSSHAQPSLRKSANRALINRKNVLLAMALKKENPDDFKQYVVKLIDINELLLQRAEAETNPLRLYVFATGIPDGPETEIDKSIHEMVIQDTNLYVQLSDAAGNLLDNTTYQCYFATVYRLFTHFYRGLDADAKLLESFEELKVSLETFFTELERDIVVAIAKSTPKTSRTFCGRLQRMYKARSAMGVEDEPIAHGQIEEATDKLRNFDTVDLTSSMDVFRTMAATNCSPVFLDDDYSPLFTDIRNAAEANMSRILLYIYGLRVYARATCKPLS